jgi:chemotaxis protein MotB
MRLIKAIVLLALLVPMLNSCVSARKYEEMEAWKDRLARENLQTEQDLQSSRQLAAELREEVGTLEKRLRELSEDLTRSRQQYTELDRANRDLIDRYDRIVAQNQQMLENVSGEKAELTALLNQKEQELNRREREQQLLQAELAQQQANQDNLQRELAAREARVAELEKAIADKEARLRTIRERVNQALRGFSEAELTVREQNGKVYVSLSQNLLFASGSKTINRQGKQAIAQLATVLNANPDINITVEGHTDTDGEAAFNWDLSVGRATTVVKELTTNGVDPKRIIASGRGEFFPVATNETSVGKALNRRTEIILTPRLEGLYELLGE